MTDLLKNVVDEIQFTLADLSQLFVPGAKLTFIARFPDDLEGTKDLFISNDTVEGVAELIERTKVRDQATT